jgi:hypothetical protein
MKKNLILLTAISAPRAEKARTDGKASRQFITVTAAEALQDAQGNYYPNPFTAASRNVWQKHSADGKSAAWGSTSPEALGMLKSNNNAIPGEIVSKKVKQFPVIDAVTGKQRTTKEGKLVFADSYTTVLFGNEDVVRVFKAANHEIVEERSSAPATKVAAEQLSA